MRMDIELISDKPIKTKPYRMSPRQINILREEIKRLLELGVIEIGQSDYTSPLILVESPNKDPRPCVDYRRLNEITRAEFFPLPNMEEIVEKVSAAPYVTVMDLSKGYFQIPLTPRAQRYAAFVTPFGTYIPKKMMFGLVCAPYYFCKLMAQVLEGLEQFALPYIDDIAIFSQGLKDHVKHIDIVLGRLRKAGLKVKPSKCKFAQEEVLFLGHRIGSGSRSPSDLKIKAIADFPRPTTKTHVRSFLGLVGYYSHYIPNYSTIASPLTDALKGKIKKEKITWDEKCGKAFEELKAKLVTQPILFAPDFATEFILQTDASEVGAGVVLSQRIEGEEHPIVFLSKKFSKAERNYSTVERELAAIIFGLKRLKHYLDGQKFIIETDHNPLRYLNKMGSTNPRLQRWALSLQPFNFEIKHKPGRLHGNADGLSRLE
ncbi:retrovirus-related Pol polyprotein from transposon 297 [Trichonephila clavipes]|nr:retrovirus-related Pol polyprotein from transposon 297 [Trichonephila clavipes]